MDFLQKLDWLMEQRGLNKHTLAQQSGIAYTTIVGLYERGKDNARVSTVNRLCAFFHVSLDYLLLDEYQKPEDFTPNGNAASVACSDVGEIELIHHYRSMNKGGKDMLLNTARVFAGNPEMQEGHIRKKEIS